MNGLGKTQLLNVYATKPLSEALVLSSQYKVAIIEIYSKSGVCPTSAELGLSTPINAGGNFVHSVNTTIVTGAICAIEFTFKSSGIAKSIQNKHITLALIEQPTNLGASNWTCTSTDIAQKYLPKACIGN